MKVGTENDKGPSEAGKRILSAVRRAMGLDHVAWIDSLDDGRFQVQLVESENTQGCLPEGTVTADLGAAAAVVSGDRPMVFIPEGTMPLRPPYSRSPVHLQGAVGIPALGGVVWADRVDGPVSQRECDALVDACALVSAGIENERIALEARGREGYLTQVLEGLRGVLESTSEQACVGQLVEIAAGQTGSEIGLVALKSPHETEAAVVGCYGRDARKLLGKTFEASSGLVDLAMKSGASVPAEFRFSRNMHPVLGPGCDLPVTEGDGILVQPVGSTGVPMGALVLIRGQYGGALVVHGLRTLCDSAALLMYRFRLQGRVERDAMMDGLTGLYNRQAFVRRLGETFAFCKRHGHDLCMLMIDADHFKRVNDEHGHLVGDRVLRFITDTVQRALRESDMAGRYGGEEFCVLLPNTDTEGARLVADRIRETCAASVVPVGEGKIRVTVSIGVSAVSGTMEGPDDLIATADEALYLAKDGGRNRVVLAAG